MHKISITTISESSSSPSSRFGSNLIVHSLHAERFQEACCLCWMRLLSSGTTPLRVYALQSHPRGQNLLRNCLWKQPFSFKSLWGQSRRSLPSCWEIPGTLLLVLDASSLLLLHAFAGLGRVRKRRSPQRRFGRHGPPSLFTAILVDKISLITVFEGSWSPSSRFGSNPAFHSLHAETFQEAGCLCWMHQNLLSSCSTPLQVPAVCVNAGLLNDALGDKGFLPSLFRALTPIWAKSQSQLFLKAAGLLQVALGAIPPFTPFMLRHSRNLAACAGCVFSPLAPCLCRSRLFKALTPLWARSQSQLFLTAAGLLQVALGAIPLFTPFMLRNSGKLAACAGCVFSPLAPRLCRSRPCA